MDNKHWRRDACFGVLVLLFLGISWLIIGKVQLCVFRMYTGVPCPGCGLTHAAIALLKGDWKSSLCYHPLLILVLFTLAVAIGYRFKTLHFLKALHANRYFYVSVIVLLVVLYVIRMILYFPSDHEPMNFDRASLLGKLLDLF